MELLFNLLLDNHNSSVISANLSAELIATVNFLAEILLVPIY